VILLKAVKQSTKN